MFVTLFQHVLTNLECEGLEWMPLRRLHSYLDGFSEYHFDNLKQLPYNEI